MLRRYAAARMASEAAMGVDYYAAAGAIRRNLADVMRHPVLGIFSSYRLAWLVPLAAAWRLARAGAHRINALMLLIVACAAAQLVVAADVSRLMGLAFPAFLIAAEVLHRLWGHEGFARRLWLLLLVNLLIPPAMVSLGGRITVFYPLPVTVFVQFVFGVPL